MKITTLFLDIGGVFLTNGWDRNLREKAANQFRLNYKDLDERHRLFFNLYELGKLSLDEYLENVIFYEKRDFSLEDFKKFMFSSAHAYPEMIELFSAFKNEYNLKAVFVSNEGRELAEDRIRRFPLKKLGDFFIVSSFVQARKPDKEIYQIALDLSQAKPDEILYVDDRKPFVELAKRMGLNGIHHQNFEQTKLELARYRS